MGWLVPRTFADWAFIAVELFMAAWIWGMWWAFGPGGDARLKAWEAKRAAKAAGAASARLKGM
ncbi:hypothetical protein [Mycobacterium sp.]|uniref:hypothetical protein n=1 Tax=Mycobacterium sp. TaxID=1785 RepID=UPI00262F12E8|nr:hypothetical protein [Mycobacterium sp.]